MSLYDILIGYPRWSEVQVNYWYAVADRMEKLGAKQPESLFFMDSSSSSSSTTLLDPIWPDNATQPEAVTFISNCNAWQRNHYVEVMQGLGLRIDHYGGCSFGKPRLGGSESKETLQAKYPFILAFENSVLDDYITEKYFQGLMNPRSIMVYMGSRRIHEMYAPVLNKPYVC